jgi:hypothetical protein
VTQVFDESRTADRLVVRQNTFRNGRRVGVLAKGTRALVEGNLAQGLGGGGLELWNAPFEGLCAHDYLVRGNVFNDTNQLDRESAPVWIVAFNNGPSASLCHGNLTFVNNTIAVGPGPLFLLSQVANVTIANNRFLRCASDPSAPIVTVDTAAVISLNNTLTTLAAPWLCTK